MFAYCNNTPVNAFDPDGHVILYISIRDDPTLNMFFGCGGNGGGGGGGSTAGMVVSGYVMISEMRDSKDEATRDFYNAVTGVIGDNNLDGALENENIQNLVAIYKIVTGPEKIKDGLGLILLPEPTLLAEAVGAALIAWGFNNIVTGIGELFDWGSND